MSVRETLLGFGKGFALVCLLVSCATSGGDKNANTNNELQANNNNGNNNENLEQGAENLEQNAEAQGEQVNNASENDTQAEGNLAQESNGFSNNVGLQGATGEAAVANSGEGVNNAPADDMFGAEGQQNAVPEQPAVDNTVNPVVDAVAAPLNNSSANATQSPPLTNVAQNPPVEAAPAVDGAAPPAPSAGVTPVFTSSGVVRYIRDDQIPVFDQPGGSSTMYTFEQGDHPLVLEDGAWARIQDGFYVSTSHLSEKGVPRKRVPSSWQ